MTHSRKIGAAIFLAIIAIAATGYLVASGERDGRRARAGAGPATVPPAAAEPARAVVPSVRSIEDDDEVRWSDVDPEGFDRKGLEIWLRNHPRVPQPRD
jgi:hypothetical protein